MARPKNPFVSIKKCANNIGKNIRITMRSGAVIEGVIWGVQFPTTKGRGESIGIQVKVWDSGLASKNKKGLPSGQIQIARARLVEKFEYLWEVQGGGD